jgi:hypothetical protein
VETLHPKTSGLRLDVVPVQHVIPEPVITTLNVSLLKTAIPRNVTRDQQGHPHAQPAHSLLLKEEQDHAQMDWSLMLGETANHVVLDIPL